MGGGGSMELAFQPVYLPAFRCGWMLRAHLLCREYSQLMWLHSVCHISLGVHLLPFNSPVLASLIRIRGCAGLCIHTTCRKISRHGTDGYTSPPKEVCGFLSMLKIHHPWPVLNPRTFGPIANTVTTIPPR
jgi:hypothetical protein